MFGNKLITMDSDMVNANAKDDAINATTSDVKIDEVVANNATITDATITDTTVADIKVNRIKTQAVLIWLALLVFIAATVHFTKQMTPNSVILASSGLTASEIDQVQTVLDRLDRPNFYKTDLQALASDIGALSWVHDVRVVRDWQQGIVVSVLPKVAIANFGSEQLLSSSGKPFVPANVRNLNNPKLITVYGDINHTDLMMQQTYRLNHWFAPLGIAVQDVILTPRQTWLIRFDNGLRLMVDYERVDEKLHQLSRILIEKNLPIALDDIAMIDLRYQNGFSVTKKTL